MLGIGHDLVDIRRIERLWKEQGQRFLDRIFTAEEQAYAMKRLPAGERAVASILAKRFAAKEAVAKAFGTGIGRITFTEIGVVNTASGQPQVILTGQALKYFEDIRCENRVKIDLSLSDEYPYASAYVIISGDL